MMKHPLNRAYRPPGAFSAPPCPSSHAVTIMRLDAENRVLRRKLDAIEGLTNGVSFNRRSLAALLVFYHAVRSVLQERGS